MATITFKGQPVQTTGNLPAVGTTAPDFRLTNAELADVGLAGVEEERLMIAAEGACAPDQPIHHEEGTITSEKVLDAMLAADAMGRARKG